MIVHSLFKMRDYSKNKDYKLHCKKTGKDYYGHTTLTLEDRLKGHIRDARRPHKPCTSKEIIDGGDYEILLLEEYPCKNVIEARRRERWWIENHPCVNKNIPGRTPKEWRNDNKERVRRYESNRSTESRIRNKELRKVYMKGYNKAYKIRNKERDKEQKASTEKSRYDWLSSWGGTSRCKGLNQIAIDLFD